jgi:DNA-binding response OmpR family regulator
MNARTETPGRLLLADDEETFLLATADLLRMEGYLVDTARDGFEAADFLRENTYDLLISDILMPGNQDLDFIRLAAELSPDLQVLLITGYPSVTTAMQAIRLPVAAYLTKPVNFDELKATVGTCVTSAHAQRAVRSSHDRLREWVEDLETIRSVVQAAPTALDQARSREVLGLALGNIAGVLLDMKALFDLTLSGQENSDACMVQNCPRLQERNAVILEAIQVLEHTKGSFKSKELGQLREQLQQALKD